MRTSKPWNSGVRIFPIFIVSFLLVSPGVFGAASSLHTRGFSDQNIVSRISKQIELPAGSDYYMKFNSTNLTLESKHINPYSEGLSEHVISAVVKAPAWIQRALIRQFHNLSNPDVYADVLLNASSQYADEIAFSIACSAGGKVPSASLLKENAESLYEHDQWIQYADIVDYDDGAGNYYSTIRYNVLENGTEKQVELPPQIYYWYVVHPKITMEDVDATYGPLWRSYVFEHNDLGYPLLKEKLSSIHYVWDCTPYYQPGGRLWSTCIKEHPTAVEAVSYWIGKTVPYPAVGDRPGQPSIIAHEHNGWCGELQQIAVAAQRAALIPSVGACNVGEDHVWREFFERGWHENDNWWSDTGGAVDEPDVYAYGWGKNMSAIYTWRGDDTIIDDTARYIHPQDRIAVTFNVYDAFLQPIDGVRVTVLVKGPKDITYYKNLIWGKLQALWDKLPALLKGKFTQFLFTKFKERYDKIPGEVNGVTITTWNYTDLNGRCSFQLGKNREYLFLIQEKNLKKPWQLARHNTFRSLKTHADKTFQVIIPDVSHREQRITKREIPAGDVRFDVSYTTTAYQLQQNFFTNGIGSQELAGSVECFFVDQQNFEHYMTGKPFTCFHYLESGQANVSVSAMRQDWYLVFRNPARLTQVVVDFSVDAIASTASDRVQIVTPDTTLFTTPTFTIGDIVTISGVATSDVFLTIGCCSQMITVVNGTWTYSWNTSGTTPGRAYHVGATCGKAYDDTTILLQDNIPPQLFITAPASGAIMTGDMLNIAGQSSDNDRIDSVEIRVDDNAWETASGTTKWAGSWNVSELTLGDHTLSAKAVDAQGLESIETISFVINESGHTWGPQINQLCHLPTNLTNASNVIVYANVTSTSPYSLKTITLFWDNGTHVTACTMYRYGECPVQCRHEEDPLKNQSNAPIFGVELGQFSSGVTILYWVIAVDTAQNTRQSDIVSFTVP